MPSIELYTFLLQKKALMLLLEQEQLVLQKALGQNFLIHTALRQKLVSFIPNQHLIIEIGSGIGHFTLFLLNKASSLLGIEIDAGFYSILNRLFAHQATFLHHDILSLQHHYIENFLFTLPDSSLPPLIVGNIPYYITKDILLKLLSFFPLFSTAFLLLDQELVKDKLLKKPTSTQLNALYCMIRAYYDIKILATVPPHAFFPQPKNHSVFIQLTQRTKPLLTTYSLEYQTFIQTLFAYQNKKLPLSYHLLAHKTRIHQYTLDEIELLWQSQ